MKIHDVSLDVLRAYVTFVESPNIVVAAERLQISQPLLSKHLQTLEAQAGTALFTFVGRKKMPTQYGQKLHQVIRQHLTDLELALKDLEHHGLQLESQTVRIGGRGEILRRFAAKLEFAGGLEFVNCSGKAALELLRENKIEIAVSQYDLDSQLFVRKKFISDQFEIVFPKAWHLHTKTPKQLIEKLIAKPYLGYDSTAALSKLLEHFGHSEKPPVLRQIADWQVLKEMVSRGRGWSLMPSPFVRGEKEIEHVEVPSVDLGGTDFYLYYPRTLSRQTWFKDFVQEVLGSVPY
jgi:DNA-binding transcriptional LysR family regulator